MVPSEENDGFKHRRKNELMKLEANKAILLGKDIYQISINTVHEFLQDTCQRQDSLLVRERLGLRHDQHLVHSSQEVA